MSSSQGHSPRDSDLELWRQKQIAERDRLRMIGEESGIPLTPPERPPKKVKKPPMPDPSNDPSPPPPELPQRNSSQEQPALPPKKTNNVNNNNNNFGDNGGNTSSILDKDVADAELVEFDRYVNKQTASRAPRQKYPDLLRPPFMHRLCSVFLLSLAPFLAFRVGFLPTLATLFATLRLRH